MAQKNKKLATAKRQFQISDQLKPTTWQDLLRFLKWMVRTLEVPAAMVTEFLVETSDGALDDAIVEGIKTAVDAFQEEDVVEKTIQAIDKSTISVKDFDQKLKTAKAMLTPWFARDFSDKVAIQDFARRFSQTKLGAFFNKLAPGPKTKVTGPVKNDFTANKGKSNINNSSKTGSRSRQANNISAQKEVNEMSRNNNKPNNKKTNHPEWYLKGYSNKIKSGLNWLQAKSSDLRVNYAVTTQLDDEFYNYRVTGLPSIMSLDVFENALFVSPDDTHINVAVDKIYSAIRHANSGAINYSPSDLRDYLLTYNFIIAAIENFIRLYKAAYCYDALDRALPWQIYKLSGMRWSSFQNNLSRFETDLRQLMYSLNSYRAPKLHLFDRTKWLYSSIFKDSNDVKSNYYQFTLGDGVLVDDEGFTKASNLYEEILSYKETNPDASVWINQGWEYEVALNQLEQLINTKLVTWRNGLNSIISGDIIKAFGNNTFQFSQLTTKLPIVYDEYVLQQVENASLVGDVGFSGTALLMSNQYYEVTTSGTFGTMFTGKTIIDSYKDSLSLGETFSITRLSYCAPTEAGEFKLATQVVPDKLIMRAQTIVPTLNDSDDLVYRQIRMCSGDNEHDASVLWYSTISRFVYHPKLLIRDYSDYSYGPILELNNFAIVDTNQLSSLHEAANTSLLYIDDKFREPYNLSKLTDLITD